MLTEILIKYFIMFFWFMLYLSWGALRAEAKQTTQYPPAEKVATVVWLLNKA